MRISVLVRFFGNGVGLDGNVGVEGGDCMVDEVLWIEVGTSVGQEEVFRVDVHGPLI